MKTFIALFIISLSTLSLACGDQRNKPGYLHAKKVECTTLFGKITDVTMTVNGKSYPFAMELGDLSGECPDPNRGCYTPYYNIVHRGNAICRAFGFKGYATSNDWGIWKDLPDEVVGLKRTSSGKWGPKVIRINHSRMEYAYTRTITCYPNYKK